MRAFIRAIYSSYSWLILVPNINRIKYVIDITFGGSEISPGASARSGGSRRHRRSRVKRQKTIAVLRDYSEIGEAKREK